MSTIGINVRIPEHMKETIDKLAEDCDLSIRMVVEALMARALWEVERPSPSSMEKLERLLVGAVESRGQTCITNEVLHRAEKGSSTESANDS